MIAGAKFEIGGFAVALSLRSNLPGLLYKAG